jgi:hypothetical protein
MAPIKKYDERSGIETTIFQRSDKQYQLSIVSTDENRLVEAHVGPLFALRERAASLHQALRSK